MELVRLAGAMSTGLFMFALILIGAIIGDDSVAHHRSLRKIRVHKCHDIGKMPADIRELGLNKMEMVWNGAALEKCPIGIGSLDYNVPTLTKRHWYKNKRRRS